MSVTLTDEQASQLAALLRDLEAQPLLRPVLRIRSAIAALKREPAPADADAGTGNSSKGTVPHAPRCAVHTEPGDTALTEEECCTCGAMRPAPDVIDALNQPMISDHNIVATHRVVEPAPCPHREALENLNDAYCSAACSDDGAHKIQCSDARAALKQPCAAPTSARCLGCEDRPFGALWSPNARPHTCEKAQPCAAPCSCRQQLMAVIDSVKESVTASILASGIVPYRTASAIEQLLDTAQKERCECGKRQSCAAPGEAGEWSEAGLVTHKFKAHYDVAGSCTEPLSNIAQDGDYIRVYEPRYRRRAPEREGGAR